MEAAVLALVSSRNLEEAARVAGVTPRTLYRWQKEPGFDAAYREAKRAAYKQSLARMHQMASAAVTTLGKVMVDPATPPATKVRAAYRRGGWVQACEPTASALWKRTTRPSRGMPPAIITG